MIDPVMIDGKHLENVEEFSYFGTRVTTTGDCNQGFNTKISKAAKSFAMLKPVWRTTNLSFHTKIKIFRGNMLSIPIYGAECWRTTLAIHQRLEVFQTKCLQRILMIYWPNTISNGEQRNTAGMDTVKIKQTQWWLGHVFRIPSNSITGAGIRWTPQGKRKMG